MFGPETRKAFGPAYDEQLGLKAAPGPALLLSMGSALEVRTPAGQIAGSLPVPAAAELAFDERVDVLWIRQPDRLWAVDLRAQAPKPMPIATGLADPLNFSVTVTQSDGSAHTVQSDACAVKTVDFDWGPKPKISASGATVENGAWLAQNLGRRQRDPSEWRGFDANSGFGTMKLPSTKGCVSRDMCGLTQPFGTDKKVLVMVSDRAPKCPMERCLLYDVDTKMYSSPVPPYQWTSFKGATPGTCGPFRFDKAQAWFTVGKNLCKVGGACEQLKGQPLGWLDRGPVVGSEN